MLLTLAVGLPLLPRPPLLLLLLLATTATAAPFARSVSTQGRGRSGRGLRGGGGLRGGCGGTGQGLRRRPRRSDGRGGDGHAVVDDGRDVGGEAPDSEHAAVGPGELDAVVDAAPGLFRRRVGQPLGAALLVAPVAAVANAVAARGSRAARVVAEDSRQAGRLAGAAHLVLAGRALRDAVAGPRRRRRLRAQGAERARDLGRAGGRAADAAPRARRRAAPARHAVGLVGVVVAVRDAVAHELRVDAPAAAVEAPGAAHARVEEGRAQHQVVVTAALVGAVTAVEEAVAAP